MDWSPYFPKYFSKDSKDNTKKVDFIDVGCGYGGIFFKNFIYFINLIIIIIIVFINNL